MAELSAVRFRVDSTLGYPADEWEAEASTSAVYVSASPADRVTLRAGFVDASGVAHTATLIDQGVVDEYWLEMTPEGVRSRLRGRDPMAAALDRMFRKRYRRWPPAGAVSQAEAGAAPTGEQGEAVGRFMASEVAREAVAWAGLELAWQAPDYELREDFEAAGRVIDVLQRLVEPWSQPEPFRVDVFVQGRRVVVRQRSLSPTPDPQNVLSVRDARLRSWQMVKRRPLKFGRVRLEGMRLGPGVSEAQAEAPARGFVVEVTESTQYDAGGELVARVVEETTLRVPERVAVQVLRRTYDAGGLVSEEVVDNDWSEPALDARGAVEAPVLLGSTKTISGYEPESKIWRVLRQELTGYQYDAERRLRVETTRRLELDAEANAMVERERVVRGLGDHGGDLVRETTEIYQRDEETGQLTLQQRDQRLTGGLRPGGPPKGRLGAVGAAPLVVERVFSTDADAQDVTYANPHLGSAELERIMAQYAAAHGRREVEIRVVGVTMPWLLRGSVLQFSGLRREDGQTEIPLAPALVHDVEVEVDESGEAPASLSVVRCVFWA